MAKCEVCGKSVSFGIKVSHSHRRSNKMWKPNVRKVRVIQDGTNKSIYACTRCLRSGKVVRGHGAGVNPLAVSAVEEVVIPVVEAVEAE